MRCEKPVPAWIKRSESGTNDLRYNKMPSQDELPDFEEIRVPCGHCLGCAQDYRMFWTVRGACELHMHKQACFITLTYDPKNLPEHEELQLPDLQKFLKRYRFHIDLPIRYLASGEYGEKRGRPHYHLIIFGHDFDDKVRVENTQQGHAQYTSPTLSRLWPVGRATISEVNTTTISYVCGYATKKKRGNRYDWKKDPCNWLFDLETGEQLYVENKDGDLEPKCKKQEFITMSKRPGIGYEYFKKYLSDIFPSLEVVIGSPPKRFAVPPYFLRKLCDEDPEFGERMKERKRELGITYRDLHPDEFSYERIHTKATCERARNQHKSRGDNTDARLRDQRELAELKQQHFIMERKDKLYEMGINPTPYLVEFVELLDLASAEAGDFIEREYAYFLANNRVSDYVEMTINPKKLNPR